MDLKAAVPNLGYAITSYYEVRKLLSILFRGMRTEKGKEQLP